MIPLRVRLREFGRTSCRFDLKSHFFFEKTLYNRHINSLTTQLINSYTRYTRIPCHPAETSRKLLLRSTRADASPHAPSRPRTPSEHFGRTTGFVTCQRLQKDLRLLGSSSFNFVCDDDQSSTTVVVRCLLVDAFFSRADLSESDAVWRVRSPLCRAFLVQHRDHGDIESQLSSSKQRQVFSDHFQWARISVVRLRDVLVSNMTFVDTLGPSSRQICSAALFHSESPSVHHTCCCVRFPVVTKDVEKTGTATGANRDGQRQTKTTKEKTAEQLWIESGYSIHGQDREWDRRQWTALTPHQRLLSVCQKWSHHKSLCGELWLWSTRFSAIRVVGDWVSALLQLCPPVVLLLSNPPIFHSNILETYNIVRSGTTNILTHRKKIPRMMSAATWGCLSYFISRQSVQLLSYAASRVLIVVPTPTFTGRLVRTLKEVIFIVERFLRLVLSVLDSTYVISLSVGVCDKLDAE